MPDYTQYATNFWQPQAQNLQQQLMAAQAAGPTTQAQSQQMAGLTPQQQANAMQYGDAYYGMTPPAATPQQLASSGLQSMSGISGGGPAPMQGMSGTMGGPGYGPSPLGTGGPQGGNGSMLALMQQLGMGMGGIPQFTPNFNFQQPQYQRQGLGQQMAGAGGMPPYLQQMMQMFGNRGGLLGGGQRPPGASVGLGMPAPQGNPYRTPSGVSDPTTNTQIGNFQQPAGGMYSPTQGGAWQGTDAQLAQFLGPQSAAQQQYMAGGNNYLDEYNARRAARGLSTQPY